MVDVAVIGAGPAGLTAAYRLAQQGRSVQVLEADPLHVGGISRTCVHRGCYFDIGGHRFFSKAKAVEDFWSELLPADMLTRPRSSRIYYRGRYFAYPLRAGEALLKLGPVEAARCVSSYVRWRIAPHPNPATFEEWVTNQFGRRLFEIFFRTYSEKVWGMKCSEISADWAAHRIRTLSLGKVLREALRPRSGASRDADAPTSLISTFRYPRLGPGMLWEACARKTRELGGQVALGRRVSRIAWSGERGAWKVLHGARGEESAELSARHVVSSAPLRDLAEMIEPPLGEAAASAARSLRYRDFLTVVLVLRDRGAFPDNWIYIHDPSLRVGRIQNYRSWSPEMVPDPSLSCYGLEYFCFEGDALWRARDDELVDLARRELGALGLAGADRFLDGCVVRQPKAYPVYDSEYAARVSILRTELEERFPTLHLVGRNGLHRYFNQDSAIMTAMLCARNIVEGSRRYDVWRVDEDALYPEEITASEGAQGEDSARSP